MAARAFPWEEGDPEEERFPWGDAASDGSDSNEGGREPTLEEAGAYLSEALISAYLDGLPVSARTRCIIAYWASRAGA